MPKEVNRDYATPPPESEGQLPFDRPTFDEAADSPDATVPAYPEKYEPHLPLETAQAIGQVRVEAAQEEADRRMGNYPHVAGQIRADVDPTLEVGDDFDKEVKSTRKIVAKAAQKPKAKRTRRGLGSKQLLNADGPPPGIDDARKSY
ncbi:hypothetical protein KW794_03010 [Candidatus Saccharibacteria bacterium]|nr:hypothetical protein [Candidatus Saccharibacteria bacterium]